ncbi:MAG: ribonuclease III domain-containing protein [Acutalibacteraceae bacterium]|nr:ribonuclease III domain-containing protein [Acutalibacteraceae bacterium]
MRFLDRDINLNEISPLTLSFIGDSVYDLLVREKLVCEANRPVGVLSNKKVNMVNCKAQAETIEAIMPYLTEEEETVYKRGKNAHTTTVPKNARNIDYHRATGLEALFGYVYLKGDIERLRELFCLAEKMTGERS